MTAFSSILGFLPLLIAAGAGAASRQAVGNAVVGGMMAATVFSLLFVPTFFVVFRWLGELGQGSAKLESLDNSRRFSRHRKMNRASWYRAPPSRRRQTTLSIQHQVQLKMKKTISLKNWTCPRFRSPF